MSEPIKTWRFDLPNVNMEGWAIVFIDNAGCFTAVSDWGDVAYRWPNDGHCGPSFIRQCDDGYLIRKLGQGRQEYDPERTVESVRDFLWSEAAGICYEHDERGEETVLRSLSRADREQLRFLAGEWERLREFDDLENEFQYGCWYHETRLDDASEFYRTRYERDVINFVTKVMPRLRPLLTDDVPALVPQS